MNWALRAAGSSTTPSAVAVPARPVRARCRPPAPHNVADALAAAALARAYGDQPDAIAAGLASFVPEPHRI